ncbi:sensor histidine kinase [Enterococcus sp. HY326]|uniref:sensor histidine kinase n=1 Tax=Enterococcus sp. HY326 TaxID=2971265 RepID=UPI0022409605|nr:GHKL domain-containing protein [Enterococcus sp. HY326]
MIYFYTQFFSTEINFLNYLVQTLPILITFYVTMRYFFPLEIPHRLLVITALPVLLVNGIFNGLIQYFFQEVMVIHNVLIIHCYFLMMILLYLIYHRGQLRFQLNLLLVTISLLIWTAFFDYLRICLMYYLGPPLFSIFTLNWYFLLYLLLLPLIRILLNWANQRFSWPLKQLVLFFWYVLIALVIVQLFVQISAVTAQNDLPGYVAIFISSTHLGIAFLQWLVPNARFMVEPVNQTIPFSTALIVFVMIIIGAFFFLLFLNDYRKQKLLEQEKHRFELTQYVDNLESMSQKIRKNHHDFSNILFSLGGYIYQKPINEPELKNYFQTVSQTFEADYQYFLEVSKLKNLEIPELKSLLFTKMMVANEKGIDFHLEIEETIQTLPLDELSLSRIFGILVDNALEAALESPVPYVHLALIDNQQDYLFIVVNSTKKEVDAAF